MPLRPSRRTPIATAESCRVYETFLVGHHGRTTPTLTPQPRLCGNNSNNVRVAPELGTCGGVSRLPIIFCLFFVVRVVYYTTVDNYDRILLFDCEMTVSRVPLFGWFDAPERSLGVCSRRPRNGTTVSS